MKIGFPLLKEGASADLLMTKHMHECEYLGIFDPETDKVKVKSVNDFKALGADANLMQCFINEEIACILSPEFHPMAAKYFADHGIRTYKTQSDHVLTSIGEFLRSELEEFNSNNIIQGKSCSSDCGACSSTCSDEEVQEKEQELVSI